MNEKNPRIGVDCLQKGESGINIYIYFFYFFFTKYFKKYFYLDMKVLNVYDTLAGKKNNGYVIFRF